MSRRLRRIRYARGTSLRAVADRVGISPPYLAKLETGDVPWTGTVLLWRWPVRWASRRRS
jgi:transcriptional regulator with XRE-family HTH domain